MAGDAAYPAVKPVRRCGHRPGVAPSLPVGHAGWGSASPAGPGANHQEPVALPAAVAGHARPAAGDSDQVEPGARYAAASRTVDAPSLPGLRSPAEYRAR